MNDGRSDASKTVYCSKEADDILDWLSVRVINLRKTSELIKEVCIVI